MNFLNLDTLVEGDDYRVERKLFWVYLWLLIFEGALRKWILPGLSTPLLLVREPIVIYVVIRAMIKGYVRHPLVFAMIGVSTISLICTFLWGHHDFLVGLFGWRIYFFHFPFMFVIGTVLTRDDLLKILRFILYISIPMTVLVVLQFYSPQSAWVNRGIGGDENGAGFGGAMGYFRPPGTFSFISGYVAFQGVVCAALLYFLMENRNLSEKYRINPITLGICLVCYLVSLPTSISRTHIFQTVAFLLFLTLSAMRNQSVRRGYYRFVIVALAATTVILGSGMMDTQVDAMSSRFESASRSEGGVIEGSMGNRYFGSFGRAIRHGFKKFPLLGYGLGLGTNAGAKMMGGNMYAFGFNGEEEWQRVIGESGLVFGIMILSLRLLLSFSVLIKSYIKLAEGHDSLPWVLACGVLLTIPNGQWAIPTNLGFCVLFVGLALAAINTSKNDVDYSEDVEYESQ